MLVSHAARTGGAVDGKFRGPGFLQNDLASPHGDDKALDCPQDAWKSNASAISLREFADSGDCHPAGVCGCGEHQLNSPPRVQP